VKLLLDTHVLVWLVEAPAHLSNHVAGLISDQNNEVLISAASAWEITTKVRLGKMQFDETFLDDFDTRVRSFGFSALEVTSRHVVAGARLLGLHRDPFDRLLAGQAMVEGLTLVTRDAKIASFGVPVVW
jgi:PIN domain nuclease of toxin-antitoxin system